MNIIDARTQPHCYFCDKLLAEGADCWVLSERRETYCTACYEDAKHDNLRRELFHHRVNKEPPVTIEPLSLDVQFKRQFSDYLDKMKTTMLAKNADYAGGNADPFNNFTTVERLGVCPTEIGFLTRMTDKFCRIVTFAKRGVLHVKDESVEDTLLDLANYCLLLATYIKLKREPS